MLSYPLFEGPTDVALALSPAAHERVRAYLRPRLESLAAQIGIANSTPIVGQPSFLRSLFAGSGDDRLESGELYAMLFPPLTRGVDDRLEWTPQILLTLDASACTNRCEISGLHYSVVSLRKRIAAVIVHLPLSEIFAFLAEPSRSRTESSRESSRGSADETNLERPTI